MFAPNRGFSGMADSMEPCTMLWGRPLLLWQQHLGKFGLFFEKIVHESSCMPHRPDMFGHTSGDEQRGRPLLPRQRHLRQAWSLIAYRFVCLYVCMYVHMSVWLSVMTNFKLILLFCFSMESSHFLVVSFPWPPLQNAVLRFFYLGPKLPKFTPQNLHKITYKSACMADRPDIFDPTRGFSGMADSLEPCKMLYSRPLLPWQWNLGKFLHKIDYKSACMARRPERFGGRPGGPTLVTMTKTFCLGAEI